MPFVVGQQRSQLPGNHLAYVIPRDFYAALFSRQKFRASKIKTALNNLLNCGLCPSEYQFKMATLSSRGFPRVVTPWKQFPILSRRARYEHRFPFPFCQCLSTGRMTPKIASMWNSVIPKFLRNGDRKASKHGTDIGIIERNPAVFYILMFILIGSQAIHLLQLRTSHENFLRSTNSKIRQLSEVIDKLKNGEEVDVKKALGTGNKASEDEWEEGSYFTRALTELDNRNNDNGYTDI